MKTRQQEFEEWCTKLIFGDVRGFRALMMKTFLRALSILFYFIVKLRLLLFRKHISQVHYLGMLTISVGNITAGGTGKTPVVEFLSRELAQRGRKCAILTRGYKSKDLDKPQVWMDAKGKRVKHVPKVASDGKTRYLDALHAGDEPFMLARNLDGVAVLVDKNRVKSGIFAIEQLGCDTLILDDGMQHLKLYHELDIVLVDCGAPFGTGSLLPRGTMREPKSSLKRASYIILTKSENKPQDQLIATIKRYNAVADIIVTNHAPLHLENVYTGEQKPLDFLKGKHVACISGIARPKSFEDLVERVGAHVIIRRQYPDHHWFDAEELESFELRCVEQAADFIVTTEKDAVRFLALKKIDIPIYFLRIHIDILEGQQHWDKMIARICKVGQDQPSPEWN